MLLFAGQKPKDYAKRKKGITELKKERRDLEVLFSYYRSSRVTNQHHVCVI
jgi:hypothetical protein